MSRGRQLFWIWMWTPLPSSFAPAMIATKRARVWVATTEGAIIGRMSPSADPLTVREKAMAAAISLSVAASLSSRSEKHTSELQSPTPNSSAGFCLQKKKTQTTRKYTYQQTYDNTHY